MDAIDRKILYALDRNARCAFTEIGRAARISPETVRYRINRLVDEGIIERFLTVFDNAKRGYSYYQLLLKLQNVNEKKKDELITFFRDNHSVIWIGNLEGSYDVAVILAVKTPYALQLVFDELQQFNQYIMKKVISILVRSEFLSREYLKPHGVREIKKIGLEPNPKKQPFESIVLDAVDKKICSCLSNDARMSCVEIARRVSLSPDAVLQRLRKLEKELIVGYVAILNQERMQQLHYKVLLYLNASMSARASLLLAHLRSNVRVIAIVHTLAEWDYEVDLELENVQQLKTFTMELTNIFSDIVRDYSLLQVVSMPKYTFYPQ